MHESPRGFHLVVSFGDIFKQSGYRTRILGELDAFDRSGPSEPVLIAFDRDAPQLAAQGVKGVRLLAHGRNAIAHFYRDLFALSREGPIRTVHAHNLYSGALALSARPFFRYKVLLDLHGRIPEEFKALGKGGPISRWLMQRLESWVTRRADHVICVSHKLKDYVISAYPLPSSNVTVIPDCADPAVFKWDAALRTATRQRLRLDGKFVCVHLGGFFMFYDPELIVNAFKRIADRVPAHLLVATGEVSKTREYLNSHLPAEMFTVTSVPHEEVPALLTAADLGFLLLRSSPNIEVSSPTKFAEYLNAGLPVLITPNVGDFSGIVAKSGAGAIVTDDGDFDPGFAKRVFEGRDTFAEKSREAGQELAWAAYREAWDHLTTKSGTSADSAETTGTTS